MSIHRPVTFDELKTSLKEALKELDETGGKPLDFEEIKRKGRERLTAYRIQQQSQSQQQLRDASER